MSSSDEEAVRGPGRNAVDGANDSGDENKSPYGAGNDNLDDDDADLFGSDGEDNVDNDQPHRTLDDEQLDSGDDENRYDRMDEAHDDTLDRDHYKTLNVQDIGLARAPVPTTHNGEVYTMHVPDFLTVEAEEFNPETYISPSHAVAKSSLCWRIDPEDGSLLQSNARIIQWDNGSLTLQLAHAPLEQYRIESKPLAPLTKSGDYDVKLDSHVYLGAAIETASLFRLTSHVKYGLTLLPTTLESDDAVRKLQESLAAASRSGKQTADGTAPIIDNDEDPLLGQRKAEAMERDAIRVERRRQQLADREAERPRRGPMSRGSGAMNIGGLEDSLSTRPRGKPRRPTNRRGEINTDDEEDYGRGPRNREDEYDEDDGFLVGSDEDIEEEEDEEEEEELEDEDADAEGEVDDEVAPAKASRKHEAAPSGSPPARKKNRYVVDDEDEDE